MKKILLISIVLHVLAGIFSTGFQHFDEHFQIIEFMNLKHGGISGGELAWEYREKIRPWFQPFTYYYLSKLFFFIKDPFALVTFLRILTSLFGVFALYQFIPVLRKWFSEKYATIAYALMSLSWFTPYIFARTSSESFGISFFLLGTSLFLRLEDKKQKLGSALFAGLLFGLSYQSRFQMAAMVAPLWFWALFFRKHKISWLTMSALGVILALGLGVLIDYWGYGTWNFSLWHYFRTNFLEGIMGRVKQYPFWWYVRLAFNRGIPPVSLVLIVATFWGWWKYRKHPLTWMTLPLFLFHSYVGHKELRYIFPIITLSPLFLTFLLRDYPAILKNKGMKIFKNLVVGVNLLLLVIVCFRPANPSVELYNYVYHSNIDKLYTQHEDPFTMLGLPLYWYRKKDLKTTVWKEETEIPKNEEVFIFYKKGQDYLNALSSESCELQYSTYPAWLVKHFNIGGWVKRSRVWSIFKCYSKGS